MDDMLVFFGGELKALGGGKVGGYLVQFGSPDQTDLEGEYFTADTDFDVDDGQKVSVYYQHGMDDLLGKRRLGKAELRRDDVGVWMEAQLALRDEYERAIYGLAEAGKLGLSSGTAGHLMERELVDGKAVRITRWPIVEASLTPTPAEPRTRVIALKSLMESSQEPAAAPETEQPVASPVTVVEVIETESKENTMAENEQAIQPPAENGNAALEAQIKALSERMDAVLKHMEDEPAIKNVGYFTADGGKADPQIKTFGDFLKAVARGDEQRLAKVYGVSKAMSEESGAAGGYLVPEQFVTRLMELTNAVSPVVARVQSIPVQSPAGEFPSLDQTAAPTAGAGNTAFAGGVVGATRAEAGAYGSTDATLTLIEWRLNNISGYTQVSKELMADSPISIEALLSRLFAIAVAAKLERHIIRGTGAGEPLGIMNAPCAVGATTVADNTFALADVYKMHGYFHAFGNQPVWICHPSLIPDIGAMELSTGSGVAPLNDPRNQGVSNLTLLGYPVIFSEHSPQANNAGDAILADLSAYLLFEKGGLEVAYSEHAAFTTGQGTWRFDRRVDGQPWLKGAITLADPTGSYTVSPFVYHND